MNKNTDLGYFEYKKQKMQKNGFTGTSKFDSKFAFILKLFFATFIIIFIVLVVSIMKFSSRVDIEYTRGDSGYNQTIETYDEDDDLQRKIDNRLSLIQQEENAPSEAKIITSEKDRTNSEVIDPKLMAETNRLEKEKKLEEKKAMQKELISLSEADSPKKADKPASEDNITVVSKVVVGHYSTFDEAKEALDSLKHKTPDLNPFVRKIGETYGIQMGSYKEFSVAKAVAQGLKIKGLDVWIYQQ